MNLSQKMLWHSKRKIFSAIYFIRFLVYPYSKIKGVKLPVDKKWSFPLLKALYDKTYEEAELKIIDKVLEKNDKVLEIGTGLGLISSFCSKRIDNNNIITYEANPLIKNHLFNLYKINKVSPILNIALVTDNNRINTFYSEPNDIWSSSMKKLSETALEIKLNSVNIADIILKYKPNFLIIDIEGAEYDLISKIDFTNINKLQIELHKKLIGEEKINEVVNIITSDGFKVDKSLSTSEQFYFYKDAR
jgi:FkbM family methyltransferase